jgi:hypothetical protein
MKDKASRKILADGVRQAFVQTFYRASRDCTVEEFEKLLDKYDGARDQQLEAMTKIAHDAIAFQSPIYFITRGE